DLHQKASATVSKTSAASDASRNPPVAFGVGLSANIPGPPNTGGLDAGCPSALPQPLQKRLWEVFAAPHVEQRTVVGAGQDRPAPQPLQYRAAAPFARPHAPQVTAGSVTTAGPGTTTGPGALLPHPRQNL